MKLSLIGLGVAAAVTSAVVVTQVTGQEGRQPQPAPPEQAAVPSEEARHTTVASVLSKPPAAIVKEPRLRIGSKRFRHGGSIYATAFSPDSRLLAVSDSNDEIRVWDVRTGELVHLLRGLTMEAVGLVFSSDGKKLYSAQAYQPHMYLVWDLTDDQAIPEFHPADPAWKGMTEVPTQWRHLPCRIAIAPDDALVATGAPDGTVVVHDATAGKNDRLPAHQFPMADIAFSADGKLLASIDIRGNVCLFRAVDKKLSKFAAYEGQDRDSFMMALAFSPLDGSLVTLGQPPRALQSALRFWNLEDLSKRRDVTLKNWVPSGFALSPDGTIVALAGGTEIEFLPDGKTIMRASGNQLQFLALNNDKTVRALKTDEKDSISFPRFSPDGSIIACASGNGIWLWDVETGRRLFPDQDGRLRLRQLTCAEKDRTMATAEFYGPIHVRDPQTGAVIRTLGESGRHVASITVSSDGQLLAEVSKEGAIIYEMPTGRRRDDLHIEMQNARRAAFSPTGRLLALTYAETPLQPKLGRLGPVWAKTIALYDLEKHLVGPVLKRHESDVNCLAFSMDERTLYSADRNATFCIWMQQPENCARNMRLPGRADGSASGCLTERSFSVVASQAQRLCRRRPIALRYPYGAGNCCSVDFRRVRWSDESGFPRAQAHVLPFRRTDVSSQRSRLGLLARRNSMRILCAFLTRNRAGNCFTSI